MQRFVGWLLKSLASLPLWLLHALGGAVGWFTYAVSPTYRRRFAVNAAIAGVPRAQWRAAVGEAGRTLLETPYLWLRPAGRPISQRLHWRGSEHVDVALAAGRGLVLMTPHLGSFEVCAQAYAERYGAVHPITVLYRSARKPWLRETVDRVRERPGLAAVPATLAGVRQMLRALRRGDAVGLLPDQVPPAGQGVWAPFFGRPAYTMMLAARLVQQSGATPLLTWGERLSRGAGYTVHFSPLAEPLPGQAAGQVQAAAAVNRAMESLILQRPGQYLWGYARYKQPRPAGSTALDDEG